MSQTLIPTTSQDSLDLLRSKVCGQVLVPGDDMFSSACSSWNLMAVQEPSVVVCAETVSDVQAAVAYAAEQGIPVAVQSTGHGQHRVCKGGLLLKTTSMKQVIVDPSAQTARVGAGCLWSDVLTAAQPYGLAALSGSAPHVGVVGYTLGGGYGLMLRKYGLAVDGVRSIQIVTADGQARIASKEENPDLFWAMLGGGGAFGVVTEIEISLYPHGRIYGGSIMYPGEAADEVYRRYAEWTVDLPDDVTSSVFTITFPPVPFVPEFLQGKTVVGITACVTAGEGVAEDMVAPMRTIAEPLMDGFGWMDYCESGSIHQDPTDPLPAMSSGVLLKELTPEVVQAVVEAFGPPSKSPNLKVEIRHLGGAMAEVPYEQTAVGCRREAKAILHLLGIPMPPCSPEVIRQHAEEVFAKVEPYILCRGPLNWVGDMTASNSTIRDVFDDSDFERLVAIKQQYDPHNRFPHAGVGILCADES